MCVPAPVPVVLRAWNTRLALVDAVLRTLKSTVNSVPVVAAPMSTSSSTPVPSVLDVPDDSNLSTAQVAAEVDSSTLAIACV